MMKKLTTMLSAAALMTFGAWAQDAAPVAEPVTADVAAVEAPAVVDTPAPEAAAPAPAVAEAPAAAVTAAPAEQAKPKAQEPDVLPVWEIIAFCVVVVGVIDKNSFFSAGKNRNSCGKSRKCCSQRACCKERGYFDKSGKGCNL